MAYGDYHHNAYKAASYREENKTMQVVLLYEGTLRYVRQAREAMEKKDIETRYNSITKACEILTGLQLSLDFKQGGDIAQLLYDYYAGLDQRLMSLHFSNDLAMCDLCIRHLTMMKDAWEHIYATNEKKSLSSPDEVIRNKISTLSAENMMPVAAGITVLPDLANINVNA